MVDDKKIISIMKKIEEESGNFLPYLHTSNYVSETNKKHYGDIEKWKNSCLNILKLRFTVGSDYYKNFYHAINTSWGICITQVVIKIELISTIC